MAGYMRRWRVFRRVSRPKFPSRIFTFFTIQGRAKAKSIAEKKRLELELLHKAQMIERKRELFKTRKGKIKEMEEKRNKPQSVQQMKDKMWNDGSMSNKDIIRDLKRD